MKFCQSCGTPQKDENRTCIECGALLGEPISKAEAMARQREMDESLKRAAAASVDDPLALTTLDRVIAGLDLAGIVLSVLALLLLHANEFAFWGLALFAAAFVDTAFPRINWFFEELRIQMRSDVTSAEPSDWYLISRKILIIALPVLGALALAYSLIASGGVTVVV